jgi:endogenous inhibitor of DNA gyrase (YacG/DUF329 family)
MTDHHHGAATGRRCPLCGKPTIIEFRPFCSKRCADIDLSRWLTDGYVIPGRPETDDDGDVLAPPPAAKRDAPEDA